MDNIKKFEDFLDRMQGLLDNAKKQGHIIVRVEDLENAFPELKESKNEEKPNSGIVLEDFNEREGFYKVNLAYLNKEQVEEIEELVKKWNPELAESEDEKIRKRIIQALHGDVLEMEETTKAIAWLEKQGDKKSIWHNEDEEPKRDSLILLIMQSGNPIVAKIIEPNHTFNHGERWAYIDDLLEKQGEHQKFRDSIQVGDKVTRNEDGVLVNLSQLNRVAKREEPHSNQLTVEMEDVLNEYIDMQNNAKDPCEGCDHKVKNCQNFPCDRKKAFEQKPTDKVEPKFEVDSNEDGLIADTIRYKNEQKPAWSEEDEELYREALVAFASLYNEVDPVVDWGKLYSWFKSLKGKIQPQPKQEWSEEDEKILNSLISSLARIGASTRTNSTSINYTFSKEIDWLKSLRPQNTWKPSYEQINVCKEVYADILSAKGFDLGTVNSELNRLEEQLRKLKD